MIDDVIAQQIDATSYAEGDLDLNDLLDCSLQSLQNVTMVSND